MQRDVRAMEAQRYDVIVVGGGYFGAYAAWDAVLRGLSVCLVEQRDFSGQTSANSYKIIHGGVRYLQHGDVGRMRRSSTERGAFLRTAPHLVQPRQVLIPTYGRGLRGKAVLRLGFGVYDALTAGRNAGIDDPDRRIPPARSVSRREALSKFPGLAPEGLTGGVVFADGQLYNPPRLAISVLRGAAARGARLANRVAVTGFLRSGDRIIGVRAHDLVEGRELELTARVVFNAAGPWAHGLVERALQLRSIGRRPAFSRDVGLVVRKRLDGDLGLAATTSTRDAEAIVDRGGRHLFLLPWRDYTLVGVWHRRWDGPPHSVTVSEEELDDFLRDANRAYPPLELTPDDVLTIHAGLILYNDDTGGGSAHRFGRKALLIDHAREDRIEGLITVIGERATMARHAAACGVDLVCRKLGGRWLASATAATPVHGGDVPSFAAAVANLETAGVDGAVRRALVHNHGSRAGDVLELCARDARLARPIGSHAVLAAEVVHAVRHEMALSLEDVVFRRTDLGVGPRPERSDLEQCAALMGAELGWTAARTEDEVARARKLLDARGTYGAVGAEPALEGVS